MRIPEFAEAPEDEEVTDERPDDGLGTMPGPGGGPLCPDGSERDLYEIVSGDFISRVADKNDLSIEELEAVNAENPAYQSFAPGQDLWLPCEGEERVRRDACVPGPRRPDGRSSLALDRSHR